MNEENYTGTGEFFDNDMYYEKVFTFLKKDSGEMIGISDDDSVKIYEKALELANDCRNREIDRFWTRGTYFWAFILGSYTAYFGVFIKIYEKCTCLFQIPFGIKITLLLTSFCGLFFSFSWILINKGSKFWQKNWENHVTNIESKLMADLYKVHLTTDTNEFSKCILSLKPYDYSASKVTMLGSVVLTGISLIFFIFNVGLCFSKFFKSIPINAEFICLTVIFVFMVLALVILLKKTVGNTSVHEHNKQWVKHC